MDGLKAVGALMRKELADIVRERTIIAAILIQFAIAAFSAFLMVGLTSLYDPESVPTGLSTEVAYVGPGGFDVYLRDASGVRVTEADLTAAFQGFDEGRYAAIVIEEVDNGTGARDVTLVLPDGELQTTFVVTKLKGLLRDYERALREDAADRLDTPLVYLDGDAPPVGSFTFAYTILLPLLVAMPTMLAGAIATDAFVQERSTRTVRLLLVAPLSAGGIVVGKLAVPVLLAPLQVLLWVLLLSVNGFGVANLGLLVFLSLLLALLFSGAGLAVASFVKEEGQAQAAYALVLLLLSLLGFLLPRNPLNLVAVMATGTLDAAAWWSFVLVGLAALGLLVGATLAARRGLRGDAE